MKIMVMVAMVCVVYLAAENVYQKIRSEIMRRRTHRILEKFMEEHPDALDFPAGDEEPEDGEECRCGCECHDEGPDTRWFILNQDVSDREDVRAHHMRLNLPDDLYERLCIESEDAGMAKQEFLRRMIQYTFDQMDVEERCCGCKGEEQDLEEPHADDENQ